MPFSPEDKEKYEIYSEVHLRSEKDLTDAEKITALNKKNRSKTIHLVVNIAIIIVFAFMFAAGLTTFANWFYYILFGVFALNLILIHLQKKQINSLIDYLNYKIERGF